MHSADGESYCLVNSTGKPRIKKKKISKRKCCLLAFSIFLIIVVAALVTLYALVWKDGPEKPLAPKGPNPYRASDETQVHLNHIVAYLRNTLTANTT